jgi:phospholipid/cholesterol/gamma-HCH transport system ATP-binding protein
VREIMHTLPPAAQEAIRADLDGTNQHPGYNPDNDATARNRNGAEEEAPTASIPVSKE